MNSLRAALAATLIIAAVTVPAPASAAACVNIPVVAHRGGNEHYTENTRNAFRDASNLGARMWETDLRFTSDDEPVILHDEELDRTTTGHGLLADTTAATLLTLRSTDGQEVPTLAEVMNDARVDGVTVMLELKTDPTPAQWTNLLADVDAHNMRAKLIFESFDAGTLDHARTHAPSVPTALVQALGDVSANQLFTVTDHASMFVKHYNAITYARLQTWSPPLSVFAWTANDATTWARMAGYPKLVGVITDRPATYLAWQRSRSC